MTRLVELNRDREIAIITVNNPPVNALSPDVSEAISQTIAQIAEDDAIKAVVIRGGGRTFIAGGDIHEFVKITSGQKRRDGSGLLATLRRVEDCPKPVVVAIHGTALGGGLELSLAAHYRVAVADAMVGQPEVKLGIIPGAAGTQRLPRLVGVAKAVEMCAGGNPIGAREALQLGIVDHLIEGDLVKGAVAFARSVAGKPARKTRELAGQLGTPQQNHPIFAAARENALKRQRGRLAPLKAIAAVEAATTLPFEEGCAVEQKLFTECLFSDQSKALIHLFFAERDAPKIPEIPKDTPAIPITSAAILGAGTMGTGIAVALANADIPVALQDSDQSALCRGLETIRRNYARAVERGRLSQATAERRLSLIQPVRNGHDFASADIAIEAVFENMELKKNVFSQLDQVCKPGAILATNTSSLNIDSIASATSRPEWVIGTHFFSPANVMRLLEIVPGLYTGKQVIATCVQLARKLGKVGVLAGNCTGFIGNRMFGPYRREAQFLLEEGAGVEAVDKALCDFGMAMGPLATADLAGLDIRWRIRKEHAELRDPRFRQPIIEDRLCEMGRFGRKTGEGYYKYGEDERSASDPEVASLIRRWARAAGIVEREVSLTEIVERCIYALVNEGARILEQGFALRAADIDVVYVHGYGFPAYRGGPMWYAGTVGLGNVYARICEFERQHGPAWAPAPLLGQLAEQGLTFADFDAGNVAVAHAARTLRSRALRTEPDVRP